MRRDALSITLFQKIEEERILDGNVSYFTGRLEKKAWLSIIFYFHTKSARVKGTES
jgi:hypothetical protein